MPAGSYRGCTFEPHRSVHARGALIVTQPCGSDAPWTAEPVAVDDLGRITPDRTPLGNAVPGDATRARKSVARDR